MNCLVFSLKETVDNENLPNLYDDLVINVVQTDNAYLGPFRFNGCNVDDFSVSGDVKFTNSSGTVIAKPESATNVFVTNANGKITIKNARKNVTKIEVHCQDASRKSPLMLMVEDIRTFNKLGANDVLLRNSYSHGDCAYLPKDIAFIQFVGCPSQTWSPGIRNTSEFATLFGAFTFKTKQDVKNFFADNNGTTPGSYTSPYRNFGMVCEEGFEVSDLKDIWNILMTKYVVPLDVSFVEGSVFAYITPLDKSLVLSGGTASFSVNKSLMLPSFVDAGHRFKITVSSPCKIWNYYANENKKLNTEVSGTGYNTLTAEAQAGEHIFEDLLDVYALRFTDFTEELTVSFQMVE